MKQRHSHCAMPEQFYLCQNMCGWVVAAAVGLVQCAVHMTYVHEMLLVHHASQCCYDQGLPEGPRCLVTMYARIRAYHSRVRKPW